MQSVKFVYAYGFTGCFGLQSAYMGPGVPVNAGQRLGSKCVVICTGPGTTQWASHVQQNAA